MRHTILLPVLILTLSAPHGAAAKMITPGPEAEEEPETDGKGEGEPES